jgi:predicted HicB family RNase H-like nuclease
VDAVHGLAPRLNGYYPTFEAVSGAVEILLRLNTVKLTHNTTMKPMTYKGYAAHIEYNDKDACFVGHIAGIADAIGFHADNVQDLRDAFGAAVEDYLATCEKLVIPAQTLELNTRLVHHRANPDEASVCFAQLKNVVRSSSH